MKFIKKQNSNVSPSFVDECSKKFNISPLIMEQIIVRGNDTFEKIEEYICPSKKSFHDPFKLSGMNQFIERVKLAKERNERVLIFGDYDVDGISATAIMIKTLKIIGINPKYYLPNRYLDGYGLTNAVLKKIKAEYNPELIITVDCGISCYKEVEYAKTIGIEILITDHHEIPEIIPNTIVLNAKLKNQEYEFNGLCGTGLAYKISQALIRDASDEMLSIACIATIADIVPLRDENRAIVSLGLKCLNKLPLGLKMLFKSLGVNIFKCASNEVSFKIAPKLNASGRMGDAKDSLKLYLTDNVNEIKALINKITNHNNNRKDLCSIVEKDCTDILSSINISAPSIILSSRDWDQGILGIICAKLVAKYNKPVFLFTEKDNLLTGSARSIPGINIHDLLASMSDILVEYGGHPLAAGLTLKTENFDKFITKVNEYLFENYTPDVFVPKEYYDIKVSVSDLTAKFIKDMQILEPTGSENDVLKLYIETDNFIFKPMKNYYCHCNIRIDNKLLLVYFNCSKEYGRFKTANELRITFEMQAETHSHTIKGIVKTVDSDIETIKNLTKMEILPPLEQLRYLNVTTPAKYTLYNINKQTLSLEGNFGTAFIVNSEKSYKKFLECADLTRVIKTDICNGVEDSGLNCLFIYPSSINFVKSYSKIVFLEPVADISYIAQINKLTKSQVYVPNQQFYSNYFYNINISRQNFAEIYKNITQTTGQHLSINALYMEIRKRFNTTYLYKDFYSAFLVFLELNLISFNKNEDYYILKINKNIKAELSDSKIYNVIMNFKNKGV